MKVRRVRSAEEVRRVVPSGDHWALLKWLLSDDLMEGSGLASGVWAEGVSSLIAVSAMLPW